MDFSKIISIGMRINFLHALVIEATESANRFDIEVHSYNFNWVTLEAVVIFFVDGRDNGHESDSLDLGLDLLPGSVEVCGDDLRDVVPVLVVYWLVIGVPRLSPSKLRLILLSTSSISLLTCISSAVYPNFFSLI